MNNGQGGAAGTTAWNGFRCPDPAKALPVAFLLAMLTAAIAHGQQSFSVTPSSLNFGAVAVGEVKELTAEYRNISSEASLLFITVTDPFRVNTASTARVAPGATRAITFRYEPRNVAPHTANLSGPVLNLSGQGVLPIVSLSNTAPRASLREGDQVTIRADVAAAGLTAATPYRAIIVLREVIDQGAPREIRCGTAVAYAGNGFQPTCNYSVPNQSTSIATFGTNRVTSLSYAVELTGVVTVTSERVPLLVVYPQFASLGDQPQNTIQSHTLRVTDATLPAGRRIALRLQNPGSSQCAAPPCGRNVDWEGAGSAITGNTTITIDSDPDVFLAPYRGTYYGTLIWAETSPEPANIGRTVGLAIQRNALTITDAPKNDQLLIQRVEVTVYDPRGTQKGGTTIWAPNSANVLPGAPGDSLGLTFFGSYQLTRYGSASFYAVLRPKNGPLRNTSTLYPRRLLITYETPAPLVEARGPLQWSVPIPNADPGSLELVLVLAKPNERVYDGAEITSAFAVSQPLTFGSGRPDVAIDSMELIQTVLDDEKYQTPLIAGKSALLRVFPKLADPGAGQVKGVLGLLTGTGAGGVQFGPIAPLPPKSGGTTARGTPDKNDEDDALNFLIHGDWLREGTLNVEAIISPPAGTTDPVLTNNRQTKSFTITKAPGQGTFNLAYIPVCTQFPGEERRCPSSGIRSAAAFANRLYPLGDGQLTYFQLATPQRTRTTPLYRSNKLDLLAKIRKIFDLAELNTPGLIDQLAAWLPPLEPANCGEPTKPIPSTERHFPAGVADAKFAGRSGRVFVVQDLSTRILSKRSGRCMSNVDPSFNGYLLAHEASHNFGLRHVQTTKRDGFGCGSIDPATDWPYPLSDRIQTRGFDAGSRRYFHSNYRDVMSYCAPPADAMWISPFSYRKIYDSGFQPQDNPGAPKDSGRAATATDLVLLGGTVRRDGTAGSLDPAYRLTSTASAQPSDPAGAYCVRMSGTGGVLATSCFSIDFETDDPIAAETGPPLDIGSFTLRVAYPAGTTRIVLLSGSRELASLAATGQPPTLAFTSPAAGARWQGGNTITWTASDPAGRTLTFAVLYSSDGGTNWLPLEVDITERSYTFDTGQIRGGPRVFFRVLATAGLDVASADVGPLTVIQQPGITAPATVDLGAVTIGQPLDAEIVISNSGSGPLDITSLAITPAAFMLLDPRPAQPIQAGGTHLLRVQYRATGAGAATGTLTIGSTDAAKPSVTVSLRATGFNEAVPNLQSDATADFGNVPANNPRQLGIRISNRGSADLVVSNAASSNPAFRVSGAARLTIPPQSEGELAMTFQPLATGADTGTLTFSSNDSLRPGVTVALRGMGTAAVTIPQIAAGAIVNGASFSPTVAAGSLATVFGTNMANGTAQAASLPLPTSLNGTTVYVNGQAAPLVYVSPTQINFQVPYGTETGDAQVDVSNNGVLSAAATVPVTDYALGVFTYARGAGVLDPIAVHADNSLVTPANGVTANEVLIIYATGAGKLTNAPASGEASPGSPLAALADTPAVSVGGAAARVLFAGLTPGFVGLLQLNVQLPAALPAGQSLPLVITVLGKSSAPVNLSVRSSAPATAPRLTLSANALDFGSVTVGQTAERGVTISNTGNGALTVTALNGIGAFTVVTPAAPVIIAAGGSQQVTIRFRPAVAGAAAASLSIVSNDSGSPATVGLSGTGVAAPAGPVLTLSAGTLDFGSVTAGQTKDIALIAGNVSTASITVTTAAATGPFSVIAAVPFTIAAGGFAPLIVRFTPPSSPGAFTGTLTLTSSGGSVTATLTGTGTAAVTPSPAPLLDSFVPATVTAGGGAYLLTVTGSQFVAGSTVNWNGAARPTVFVSNTQLRATIPAADIVAAGTATITVNSPAPGGGTTAGRLLTIAAGGGPTVLAQQFDGESCPQVTAYVSAIDRMGNTITSLSSANFRCTEDGQPVNCGAEPAAAGTRLSVAIVMDTSVGSGELAAEKVAAAALISHLTADDRVALVQADASAVPVGGFTNNRGTTSGSLAAMGKVGTGSALYDAIDIAARAAAGQAGRRKAVIVFAGSESTTGTIRDSAAMLAAARAAGVPVFVLSFGASANSATATAAMQQLVLDSAGRFIAAGGDLQLPAERVGQILANQHTVSWNSSNKDGAFHLFGLTLNSSQGTALTAVFYRGCR